MSNHTDERLRSAHLFADSARLKAQVELSWARELVVLKEAGLRDGMTVLDAGCGTGEVTFRLLEAFPNSSVVAVDLDPRMLAIIRGTVPSEMKSRIEILNGSVAALLDVDNDRCDFSIARFVFQHLGAPEMAAHAVWRVLKPGGVFAVIDIDDTLGGVTSPARPARELIAQRLRTHQATQGGDRTIGRQLPSLLRTARFEDVRMEVIALDSRALGLAAFRPQYDANRYRPLVDASVITESELDEYRKEDSDFFAHKDAFILELVMIVVGRKPLASGS